LLFELFADLYKYTATGKCLLAQVRFPFCIISQWWQLCNLGCQCWGASSWRTHHCIWSISL